MMLMTLISEYPAKAMDYLATGVHEIANISERRIERLVNPHLSGLPAFLVKEGGLNSGFMIAHCTAAACVSDIALPPPGTVSVPLEQVSATAAAYLREYQTRMLRPRAATRALLGPASPPP